MALRGKKGKGAPGKSSFEKGVNTGERNGTRKNMFRKTDSEKYKTNIIDRSRPGRTMPKGGAPERESNVVGRGWQDRDRPQREPFERDDVIGGRNPVREALRANRPINRLLILQGELTGSLGEIMSMARERGIPVQRHNRERLDSISGGIAHQGVVALAASRGYVELDDILKDAGQTPFILMLDEINDPHNLGAILRTADAAGVDGVVIPSRRSASLTPVVAKTSAGAVEYVPVARVTNIPATIEELKKRGLWVVGAHMEGGVTYWEAALEGPLVLVIGGEGKGLGRLAREKCDLLVTLPMLGQVGSLNASVAAGLLMYEVLRQRRQA